MSVKVPALVLLDVIDEIYNAPLAEGGWQRAIDKISFHFPSVAICLYGHDYHSNRPIGEIYAGFDPAAIEAFDTYYSSINAWAPGFGRSPVGCLLNSDAFIPRDELYRTEYYNDWLRPQERQVMGWGSLLANESGRFLAFSTTLRAADEEELSGPVREMVARLIPHIDRAFRMARLLGGAEPNSDIAAILEAIGEPAFLLDAAGRICHSNASAGAMVQGREFIEVGKYGRLQLRDPVAQKTLEQRLTDLASRDYAGETGPFDLASSEGVRALAMLSPFAPGQEVQSGILAEFIGNRPVAILIIRRHGCELGHHLKNALGLTASEVAVALAIADGQSVQEAAERRGVSVFTVRNQLRAVFGKLGVNRQSELVAKLHRLSSPPSQEGP